MEDRLPQLLNVSRDQNEQGFLYIAGFIRPVRHPVRPTVAVQSKLSVLMPSSLRLFLFVPR